MTEQDITLVYYATSADTQDESLRTALEELTRIRKVFNKFDSGRLPVGECLNMVQNLYSAYEEKKRDLHRVRVELESVTKLLVAIATPDESPETNISWEDLTQD
jgi:hypothetical protein